jgi:hypothetical protein
VLQSPDWPAALQLSYQQHREEDNGIARALIAGAHSLLRVVVSVTLHNPTHAGVRSGFLFERLISVTSDDGRASALASPRSEAGLEEQLLPMASANAEVRTALHMGSLRWCAVLQFAGI